MEYLTDALFMCDLFADTADVKAVLLVVPVREHVTVTEVHTVRAARIALRRRPIAPVHTGVLQRTGRVVAATDGRKL